MSEQSSMHVAVNWTKQRLDEMDATLASIESKARHANAENKAKADQLISDLKKRRAEFQDKAKAQAKEGEAAWEHSKKQLETQWKGFETQVTSYFEHIGKEMAQQQSTFQDIAAAQAKAWREAANQFQEAAAKMSAEGKANVEAALKTMKEQASTAEAQLQKFQKSGGDSWAAFSKALDQSRNAFDEANQKTWNALRGGGPTHS